MSHKTGMKCFVGFSRKEVLRWSIAIAVWTSLFAFALTTVASAAPPLGPTDIKANEKAVGVTLYQINGFQGSIPLKKKWVGGDVGYDLEFASSNMNTKSEWYAKFVIPDGYALLNLEIGTANGYVSVGTSGAEKWDGKTLIDKVTLSPWSLESVRQQCLQQLKNPNGTFKSSATFLLASGADNKVRGRGYATLGDPSSVRDFHTAVDPRTRVTAYIVETEDRSAGPSRVPSSQMRTPATVQRLPGRPIRVLQPTTPSRRPQARPAKPPVRKPVSNTPRQLAPRR